MNRDEASIADMVQFCQRLLELCRGVDQERFRADWKLQSPIIHHIILLGEAARRVTLSFRQGHPEIDWQGVAGMRDKMIHGYDQVDLSRVWAAATVEVPELLAQLRPLVPEEGG